MTTGRQLDAEGPTEGIRRTQMAARIAAKTRPVTVKFSDDQYTVIENRAARCKMNVAVWLRSIALQAATRPASDGRILIKEPDGGMT